MAWASAPAAGTDDWIVVAQQQDEPALKFTERVRHRAQRLQREDTSIESVDVYAGHSGTPNTGGRWGVLAELGTQMACGGRLTLWSPSEAQDDEELRTTLEGLAPILAERQIAMDHQSCEPEQRSGVRYAAPAPERHETDVFDLMELASEVGH